MKPSYKFLRVVLGSAVGATIWAGCASDRQVLNEPAGANNAYTYQRPVALDRQENLSPWHADTHPEWRVGWNMAFPNPPKFDPRVDEISIAIDQPADAPPESR